MAQTPSELLEGLRKRREFLRRELLGLDNLIALYETLSTQESSESDLESAQLELYRGRTSRAVQTAAIAESMEAARRLIVRNNRPMKRGELVRELQKMGFDLPGTDKNKVLGTNLWRSGRFRTIEGEGYWPKDVPLPKTP